jgi:hypothetical protein
VTGSGTIRVLKRDGTVEEFDGQKLAAAIWRVIRHEGQPFERATYLSDAVLFYLSRSGRACTSSAAVFEMCVKVLQHVQLARSAGAMQEHRSWRHRKRTVLRIHHEGGKTTLWDKSWLARFAQRSWHLSPAASRIVAANVEHELLSCDQAEFDRQCVIEKLNDCVASYGLADAVPVHQ